MPRFDFSSLAGAEERRVLMTDDYLRPMIQTYDLDGRVLAAQTTPLGIL